MKKLLILGVVLLCATVVVAHPHFQKTTTAKLSEPITDPPSRGVAPLIREGVPFESLPPG